jgi:hypothetical protein
MICLTISEFRFLEQSPPFYNISSKRWGFVRALGGRASTIRFDALLRNRIGSASSRRKDGEKSKQKC